MVDGEEEGSPLTPPFHPGQNFQLLNALILMCGLLFGCQTQQSCRGFSPLLFSGIFTSSWMNYSHLAHIFFTLLQNKCMQATFVVNQCTQFHATSHSGIYLLCYGWVASQMLVLTQFMPDNLITNIQKNTVLCSIGHNWDITWVSTESKSQKTL